MLRQIVSLFNFARRQKYMPADLTLELSEISTPRKQHAPIGIYTPDEMRAILSAADGPSPALAIAAFAGLRLAEVSRLDWREVRLSEKLIVVGAENAKTAARRLGPISDNLAAWLTPHVKRFGSLNPCDEQAENVGNALGNRFERAAARAKVAWKRNGFRHSYISYRVATLKDVPAVALECGNSPQVISPTIAHWQPTPKPRRGSPSCRPSRPGTSSRCKLPPTHDARAGRNGAPNFSVYT